MKKRLILISNDDGPNAKGLHSLIEVAREFGRVVVVVSEEGQSGKSHSITIKYPLRIREIEKSEDYSFYTVSGTPVDSIKIAMDQILDKKPDIVLSGVNHGSNSAVSVIYSGTMGVAMEAALHGISSIGFSLLNHSMQADFTFSKQVIRQVLVQVLKNGLPEYVTLNVNIPDIKFEEFEGYEVCRQTFGVWSGEFDKRKDPVGIDYYWLTGFFSNKEKGIPETDEYVLAKNKVSIVPIKPDLTDYSAIEEIKKWSFDEN